MSDIARLNHLKAELFGIDAALASHPDNATIAKRSRDKIAEIDLLHAACVEAGMAGTYTDGKATHERNMDVLSGSPRNGGRAPKAKRAPRRKSK
jgi:hypothetical protein